MMRALLVLALLILAACGPDGSSNAAKQSVYDKVIASNTIRCGYAVYPPYFVKTPDGQLGGPAYDVMQEVGKRLNLKVDYVTEVGWGTVVDDLRTNKIDMACSFFWANTNRGRWIEFSQPLWFDQLWAYVRGNDNRVWDAYEAFNRPDIKVAVTDGGAEVKVVQIHFPNAQQVSIPELAPVSDFLETVATGKADFLTIDANTAGLYDASNPGKLKRVPLEQPVHVFPGVYLLPPGDFRFKSMIDTALREMDLDGALGKILEKHGLTDKVRRATYMQ
ncbi:MAG: substrate-binding periplasmic protein [Bdellovibrionales bacterium]